MNLTSFFARCVVFCLLLSVPHPLIGKSPRTVRPGNRVESFILQDTRGGRIRSQGDEAGDLLIVAFLGTECPLAKHYAVRLQAISEQYREREVTVVGIFSNAQDSTREIEAFRELHKLTYPLCKDSGSRVADLFGATRTPQVFLLDKERIVRYQGRVDDQYQIGVVRDRPQQEDLKNALEAVLAGQTPAVAETEPIGCLIGREKVAQGQTVTFSKEIIRLFQERCIDCHRAGQAAPFELTSYTQARGWASMIEEVVEENRMPPWHADPAIGKFQNDSHLHAAEKQLIRDWVAAGAPEGDKADLPQPKNYPSEWLLPERPQVILQITEKPVPIPAQGEVKYQYFKVDPGFTEDTWIRGAEIRPGNYAVVHHVLVFTREKGGRGQGLNGEEGGFLAAYVPGLIPELYPPGMAKRIPAGAELIFQMHYTPNGSPQEDLSQIGLILAEPETITHQVMTSSAVNRRLEIPPYAADYSISGYSPRSEREVQLLALMPHMHLRGKAFSYALQSPAGELTPLLSIPQYDFNWQTAYRLAEPLLLPAGSRIKCVAHYDNSEANPHNPAPEKTVRWGEQTWDEMMIGYFHVAIPLGKEEGKSTFGTRALQILTRLDANNDQVIESEEVPEKWQPLFRLIDRNGDEKITLEELERWAKLLPR